MELKSVTSSVFFSSDPANPDTYSHFYADMEMYTANALQPDPSFWMLQYLSGECAQKANKWQGRNIARWRNADYDALYAAAATELDPVKRAAMFIRMNDLVVADNVLPLLHRAKVSAAVLGLARAPERLGQRPVEPARLVEGDVSGLPGAHRHRTADAAGRHGSTYGAPGSIGCRWCCRRPY